MVKDNLSTHKGERVRQLLGAQAASYFICRRTPRRTFRPIEEAFSKVEALLRKAEARSREALVEDMGKALEAVTARDARGFFEPCGYLASGQLF